MGKLPRKLKFECPWRGHRPITGAQSQPTPIGNDLYLGYVCTFCGAVYYEIAEVIVNPEGAPVNVFEAEVPEEESKLVLP